VFRNNRCVVGMILSSIALSCGFVGTAGAENMQPKPGMREVSLASRMPNRSAMPNGQRPGFPQSRGHQATSSQGGCPAGSAFCSATSPGGSKKQSYSGLPANAPKGTGAGAGKGLVPFGGPIAAGGPEIGATLEPPVVVLPEVTTAVKLSASDLNRVICPYDIKEGITSEEKGLTITVTGHDAFLKYKVMKRGDGKISYSNTPTEIFIVCGNQTYSMIGYPSRVPAQTIKLSSGIENKIKENQALYSGLPHEKRLIKAIKDIYTDSMPDTYDVVRMSKVDRSWKGIAIVQKKQVNIQGEGLRIKEYHVTLKPGRKSFKLDERMFLRKDFAMNPVAISIDKHVIKQGDVARLFVLEQRAERPFGGESLKLPSVDGLDNKPEASVKQEKAEDVAAAAMSENSNPNQEPMAGMMAAGGGGMGMRTNGMGDGFYP